MNSSTNANWTGRLLKTIKEIDRPGDFVSSAEVPAGLPGLEVDGIGPIGLPLSDDQARTLKARCDRAAHGRGTETVVDTNVRRVWHLSPERFKLANPAWSKVIGDVVGQVQRELGLAGRPLQSHLYELLLYEKGDFFLPHRDGEKLDRMVATLVIVLPSDHTGGALVVRHEGRERRIELGGSETRYQAKFAAFYADCEHEVKALESGYRLCLVYNLTLTKVKGPTGAPKRLEHIQKIAAMFSQWPSDDESPWKIALALEHQYTQSGLSWNALKGMDAMRAGILAEAAALAECRVYLALVTLWECGSCEGDDYEEEYYSRRQYRHSADSDDDDDEDGDDDDADGDSTDGEYVMGDLIDGSLLAEHWRSPDDAVVPLGSISLEEDEILPNGALREVTPEEEFEGYTGNAGMTLDRWYRRAAIFVWPDSRHFDVLCSAGMDHATALLAQMVRDAQKLRDPLELKERCRHFGERILAKWRERRLAYGAWNGDQEEKIKDPIASLEYIDDLKLIRTYLGDVLLKDVMLEPGTALVKILHRHGWETFRKELEALFSQTNGVSLDRNVRLLDELCEAAAEAKNQDERREALEVCDSLGAVLTAKLCINDRQSDGRHDSQRPRDPGLLLTAMVRSLLAIRAENTLGRLLAHATARPKIYSLQKVQIPMLIELCGDSGGARRSLSRTMKAWLDCSIGELESLTISEPKRPEDFRREAKVDCKCADCAELNRFLVDPIKGQHEFKMAQNRRLHLEEAIRSNRCDISHTTNTRPRPQILICTKNVATFDRLLKAYHENLKHLSDLRPIRGKKD